MSTETSDQSAALGEIKNSVSRLSASDFMARTQKPEAVVIDIRTPQEYDSGHLANAVNLDFYSPEFEKELGALDRNKSYSIYCRSGSRSGQALEVMKNMGFTDIADLRDGYISLEMVP